MSSGADTAVCEVCGSTSFENSDPDTDQKFCRKCQAWVWFKWPKTGERLQVKPRKQRRDGFPN